MFNAKSPFVNLRKHVQNIFYHLIRRKKLKELLLALLSRKTDQERLTADEIDVRVRAFVIVIVTLIFAFITFALLYSVTFVTQPMKSMAPIDQAYTKMLNDIVLLIVGGIGGILTKGLTNEATNMMNAAKSNKDAYVAPPPPPVVMMSQPSNWTPPPPPVSSPSLESDAERERMARARANV
jgi:hypothetical protein